MNDAQGSRNHISAIAEKKGLFAHSDSDLFKRLAEHTGTIQSLYSELYHSHSHQHYFFERLLETIIDAYSSRHADLRLRDHQKETNWHLSNDIAGMSLYVDRFCGNLAALPGKLPYLQELGINLLHLMPLFETPEGESDGGYAVSDFKKVDTRYGSVDDLRKVIAQMQQSGFSVMLDIVLNHTSHHHQWAERAKNGDREFQDFYYMFDDRVLPDRYDVNMPEIFPESSPGNFTYEPASGKWVMTVFHHYQWDLNYSNPAVFNAMMDIIFFYANLGVDILRIDAPAFIWKQAGTTCQNLPQAHKLLQLIKQCVQVASPGMVLLAEAIVSPPEIMRYFGTDTPGGQECDLAYNATQMALQWDALATTDTRVMLASWPALKYKPKGTSWITYTRCHDDIGLGFEDSAIASAGFGPYQHRKFLQDYYAGSFPGSMASGALFSVNEKTQDARISGSLASLCGLEKAINISDPGFIDQAISKILLMQAMSCFIGGIPMLFYGDEVGYTNDYSFLDDPSKNYDNRWMHRPLINWQKNESAFNPGTVESKIYSGHQRILGLRKKLAFIADNNNIDWLSPHNKHIAGFVRESPGQRGYFLFNFSPNPNSLPINALQEKGMKAEILYDLWQQREHRISGLQGALEMEGYGICVLVEQ